MSTLSSKIDSSVPPIRRSSRIQELQKVKIRNKPSKFVSSAQTRKSPVETAIPVQHHSTTIRSESKVDQQNVDEAIDCNVSNQNQHPTRISNLLPNFERNKQEKLQLPSPNDPIWKETDAELKAALPQIFNKQIRDSMNSQGLIEKFDTWIYKFLKQKFGTVPPYEKKPTFVKKPHKGLLRLREDKKRIRNAIRVMERAGLKDTPECKLLQKERLYTMRKHNRLRVSLLKANKKRATAKSEKTFKQDHWKYTKNLFHPPSASGAPSFSKEEAEAYFTPLYRDEERECQYDKLDEMKRPPTPVDIFNLESPTFAELFRSARRKSNGAAAGLNGLTYIIYKKCPSVLFYLYLIICKIWKDKDIPAKKRLGCSLYCSNCQIVRPERTWRISSYCRW